MQQIKTADQIKDFAAMLLDTSKKLEVLKVVDAILSTDEETLLEVTFELVHLLTHMPAPTSDLGTVSSKVALSEEVNLRIFCFLVYAGRTCTARFWGGERFETYFDEEGKYRFDWGPTRENPRKGLADNVLEGFAAVDAGSWYFWEPKFLEPFPDFLPASGQYHADMKRNRFAKMINAWIVTQAMVNPRQAEVVLRREALKHVIAILKWPPLPTTKFAQKRIVG